MWRNNMSNYNTTTNTNTYTVIDIRKTFEGFEADIRMIARRTGKWTTDYVDRVFHDVLKLAENKYLEYVDITLLGSFDVPVRAVRYKVNENGSAMNSDRPGGNDWPCIEGTRLTVIVSYKSAWHGLTSEQKVTFQRNNNFKISWGTSEIDNSYSHLMSDGAQLYGSKGYEVRKSNFK